MPVDLHTIRANIYPGLHAAIVQKQDQGTGALTQGIVQNILTSSPVHPRGIKVRLTTGEVGRVQTVFVAGDKQAKDFSPSTGSGSK